MMRMSIEHIGSWAARDELGPEQDCIKEKLGRWHLVNHHGYHEINKRMQFNQLGICAS
jgi:hypothetical protein